MILNSFCAKKAYENENKKERETKRQKRKENTRKNTKLPIEQKA